MNVIFIICSAPQLCHQTDLQGKVEIRDDGYFGCCPLCLKKIQLNFSVAVTYLKQIL